MTSLVPAPPLLCAALPAMFRLHQTCGFETFVSCIFQLLILEMQIPAILMIELIATAQDTWRARVGYLAGTNVLQRY